MPNCTSVFIEFPDFGFGPASTSVCLARVLQKNKECRIVSTGGALNFARKALPEMPFYNIDTSNENEFTKFLDLIPKDASIPSNTNPEFTLWASTKGYKVAAIDTLSWMWNEAPKCIDIVKPYIAQYYFGSFQDPAIDPRETEKLFYVRPIIDYTSWSGRNWHKRDGCALIGFGGMGNPFDLHLEKQYAQWILDCIIPYLLKSNFVDRIHIVGGLLDKTLLPGTLKPYSKKLIVEGPLTPNDYQELLCRSQFCFLTPGLSSIYEVACAGLNPLFLPGSNVSQVFQSVDLSRIVEYRSVALWPDAERIYESISNISEKEATAILSKHLRKIFHSFKPESNFLHDRIERYLSMIDAQLDFQALNSLWQNWQDLPTVEEVLYDLFI